MSPRDSRRLAWVTVAIILTALVMRSPIVALAPVIGDVRSDLGISATVAGILTSIPVLCFAVATPLAVWLVRRGGTTFALTLCAGGVTLAWMLRSSGGIGVVLVGTALLGVFITIGNVVVPVIIRREYSVHRAGLMTGVYISALNIGSMAVTLGTAPLEPALGWRGALLVGAVFGLAAVAVWVGLNGWRAAVLPHPSPRPVVDDDHVPPRIFRSLTVLLLAVAFAGQAFSYYGVTAWLPQVLSDKLDYSATAAGAISSIFQVAAIIGAIGAPLIARQFGTIPAIAIVGLLWLAVPLGFLVAPQQWALWSLIGGAAQGGGITIILIISSGYSRDDRHAAGVNAIVQGAGYAVASIAPALLGGVHDATGGWDAPLVVVLLSVLAFGVAGTIGAIRAHGRRPVESA